MEGTLRGFAEIINTPLVSIFPDRLGSVAREALL